MKLGAGEDQGHILRVKLGAGEGEAGGGEGEAGGGEGEAGGR